MWIDDDEGLTHLRQQLQEAIARAETVEGDIEGQVSYQIQQFFPFFIPLAHSHVVDINFKYADC